MKTEPYLHAVRARETDPFSLSLRQQAEAANIPIVAYDGLCLLRQVILLRRVRRVLELGTAIGYSAIGMAQANESLEVVSLERDPYRVELAQRNIQAAGLDARITLIEADARTFDPQTLEGAFDLVFIDASKSQGIHYFERYESCLAPAGVIVTDNVLFHGLHEATIHSRNLRQLTQKIDRFNRYLLTRTDYDTMIYPVGDGMSVSIQLR